MESLQSRVAIVVVTHNRKEIFKRCLVALLGQTHKADSLIIIDNASSDGTDIMLAEEGYRANPQVDYVRLEENSGSAGGFGEGIKRAHEKGFDWIWLMDDDAIPGANALEVLVAKTKSHPLAVFGSMLIGNVNRGLLAGPSIIKKENAWLFTDVLADFPATDLLETKSIPFAGLFLPRAIIEKVGFVNENLFMWADDMEYCLRIRRAGFSLFYVQHSIVAHAPSKFFRAHLGPWHVCIARSTPWKEYYGIRNTIFIDHHWRYTSWRERVLLYLIKLPRRIFVWFFLILFYSDKKRERLFLYARAIADGVCERLGKTVLPM